MMLNYFFFSVPQNIVLDFGFIKHFISKEKKNIKERKDFFFFRGITIITELFTELFSFSFRIGKQIKKYVCIMSMLL